MKTPNQRREVKQAKKIGLLITQLVGTLVILAWVPTNLGKAIAFVALWWLTFWRLSPREWALFLVACLVFTVMDVLTVRQGGFRFNHPDLLGIPAYEPLMWGFYLVHTWRLVNGPIPNKVEAKTWLLAAFFVVPFVLISHPTWLFGTTGAVLLTGLIVYHEWHDLAFVGYMILLGALVEYVGVYAGQWSYPDSPPNGVPLWFVTMWGGVGILLRRLALPTLVRFVSLRTPMSDGAVEKPHTQSGVKNR